MTNEEMFEAGDVEGLYRANRGLVLERIYSLPQHLQDEGIGDISFMKAVRTFDPHRGTKFSTHLTNVLLNDVRMMLRSEKKRKQNMVCYAEGHGEGHFATKDTTAEDDEQRHHEESVLAKMLGEGGPLPENERKILVLRYGIGGGSPLTIEQTGLRLSIPSSTVAAIQKRAEATLRRLMVK